MYKQLILTNLLLLLKYLCILGTHARIFLSFSGGLMLGCGSKGARLRHWIDAIKFPDRSHLAWHNLAEIDVPME